MAERELTIKIAVDGADAQREIDKLRDNLGGGDGSRTPGGGRAPMPAPVPGQGGPGGGGGVAVLGGNMKALMRQMAALVAILKIFEPLMKSIAVVLETMMQMQREVTGMEELDIAAETEMRLSQQLESLGGETFASRQDLKPLIDDLRQMIRQEVEGEAAARQALMRDRTDTAVEVAMT